MPINGVMVVDKPGGCTSHDVVARVRRILDQRAIGHLGTLDPMATGVLPLVLGRMTRLSQFYSAAEKAYEVIQSNSRIVAPTAEDSFLAGKLHAEIKSTRRNFSLADSFVLQAARKLDAKVITADPDFKGIEEADFLG